METDPVSETLCSLEYQTMDKAKNPVIPTVMQHHQNPLESTLLPIHHSFTFQKIVTFIVSAMSLRSCEEAPCLHGKKVSV
jgi:hypothetical protein